MRIGILGTRGIPNYYGGFEQFCEYFAVYLVEKGHDVWVYSSSNHPFQESTFNGVRLIHCKDPENKMGTVGQFFYDLNCIRDARKRDFDILLQLGYTSSSVWYWLLPKKPIIVTNMDGLEWKRTKFNKYVQSFLKVAEKWAVKSSDYLIADSIGIQNYLKKTYNRESEFIAYGADLYTTPDATVLKEHSVTQGNYNMLIARMEPENNIETILDGVVASKLKTPFLVVGKQNVNDFGNYLVEKYKGVSHIRFLGGIYNIEVLNNLRYYSRLYFHGHSVGGTNPSLLEAMASNALIAAHRNEFNGNVLEDEAFYFETSEEVAQILNTIVDKNQYSHFLKKNKDKIEQLYSWERINYLYLDFFEKINESH